MTLRTIGTRLAQWDNLVGNGDGFVPLSLTTCRLSAEAHQGFAGVSAKVFASPSGGGQTEEAYRCIVRGVGA
jgi:hypothetical protein